MKTMTLGTVERRERIIIFSGNKRINIASYELRPKSRGRTFLLPLYRGKSDFMTNYW